MLYHKPSFLPNEDNKDDNKRLYIEGYTSLRVSKGETVKYLRKQLQLLIIQVWSLLLSDENKYYLLDEFSCVSLFPPAQTTAKQFNDESGSNLATSSMSPDAPPAGQFRVHDVGNDKNKSPATAKHSLDHL